MKELPEVIKKINKKAKCNKIAALPDCHALELHRMFSGSVAIDFITGGGYGYRKVHILFGAKSSAKNATLNQTIAYNQRLCRYCYGLLPQFQTQVTTDRHASFLYYTLGVHECKCAEPKGKVFLILDYEKSITKKGPVIEKVKKIIDPNTDQVIDELDYDELVLSLDGLKEESNLEANRGAIEKAENYLNSLKIEEEEIERMSTSDYLAACGVIEEDLLIADPEDTEEGIEYAREVISSLEIDGIIWDSLQAAIPKWVKERDPDADSMGKDAKQNALLMRHICSKYASGDITDPTQAYKPPFFITSQLRSSLSSFFAPDTYSGGHAVKHHAHLALEFKRTVFLTTDGTEANTKNGKDYYGQTVKLRGEKNKLAPPLRTAEIDYYFQPGDASPVGIDHVKEIILLGTRFGVIEQSGAWYKACGEKFNGMPALIEFCRDNPKFVGNVYKGIKKRYSA